MVNLSDKYQPLFTNTDKRYHILTGGRGSGKSFAAALFLLLLTEQKGEVILFTRYTLVSAHISIIPEFLGMIEMLGWQSRFHVTKDEVVNKRTKSKILFKGLKTSSGDQTANLKSLSGVTCWVLDEAEELKDEALFDKIDLSVRSKNGQNRIIMILNPTTSEHFIYKKWFEGELLDNTVYVHTTYLDNKDNLDESILKEIEKMKVDNPKKYDHVILGGWLERLEGCILTNWEYGAFDESLPIVYGMDFGYTNDPTTLIKCAIDGKKKVIYLQSLLYKPHLDTDNIRQIMHQHLTRNDLVIADSAEKRLINELRKSHEGKRGLNVRPATKGPDSVRKGILDLQGYKLVISQNDTDLKRELNNYVWNDKRAGVPIDAYNHLIDPIRYVLQDHLERGRATFS